MLVFWRFMRITSYTVELDGKLNILVKEKAVNYKTIRFNNPEEIVEMINSLFRLNLKSEEHIYLLAMDIKCNLIGVFLLSKGTVDATVVNPREIFIRLFLCGASAFVIVHNHPSGDVTPSKDDRLTTKRIQECSDMMGIKFLDHIIVGDDNYFSFQKGGIL